jgi:uncharacterized SAM-binding protein YcdF (DUF218 family)
MTEWITLSKALPQAVYPLTILILLLACSLGFNLFKRHNICRIFLILSLIFLFVCSSPLSSVLYREHERKYKPIAIEDLPVVDAIVLLGGDVRVPLPPRIYSEIGGSRSLHALRLFKAGKADVIIISGGNVFQQPQIQAEAIYTKAMLVDWGVPSEAILLEEKSRNTYENAIQTNKLMEQNQIDNVLLVTSAFHMPRALETFKAAGIHVTPAPTTYSVTEHTQPVLLDWLPSLGNLRRLEALIHEKLGILVYRYRGWIA